ncbi:MAG: META domain-containing protein [Candidatus Acidiferrum sp.]
MKLTKIRFLTLVALIFVASCSSHKSMNNSQKDSSRSSVSLVGTEWILTELGGTAVVPNSKASLSFLEPGRAAGNASCNRFTGSVTIAGMAIKFGQMASTRMACVDEAVSAQEYQYLKLLGEADRYEIRDNSLLIYVGDSDKPLRFSRQTSQQP